MMATKGACNVKQNPPFQSHRKCKGNSVENMNINQVKHFLVILLMALSLRSIL